MKTTLSWIKEFVPDWSGSIAEACERFTMSGTEVEGWEALGEDDAVIEFQITANRPDCHGILGLARDFAAATGRAFRPPVSRVETSEEPVEEACSVELVDLKGCTRYTAIVIEDLKVGPSPDWLATRIEALGLRPVNNVVDVTNYVLFELNQPFHAFDLDKVAGGAIVVRRAAPGERLRAINGRDYDLDAKTTVIADAERPIAIAGVMGGLETEVGPATRRILLETARFDPLATRRTSRLLGLASDSSYRFERGVDDQAIETAAHRCARLIAEVSGGRVRKGMVDVGAPLERDRRVAFRHDRVAKVTGIEVSWDRCREIFEALGCDVKGGGDPSAPVRVEVPTWRPDLAREIDLVEEIIRIHGLEALPEETSMTVVGVRESAIDRVRRRIKERLVAGGFHETLTTPFLPEGEAAVCLFEQGAPITIRNAMRKDENALRQSLLPSLLQVRKTNQDHGNEDVRLFELTSVSLRREGELIPEHLGIVGGLLDGRFAEARGALESVFEGLGIRGWSFEPLGESDAAAPHLELSGGARVSVAGRPIGFLGRPRGERLAAAGLESVPVAFELRLAELVEAAEMTPTFRPFSRFPAVLRDLAVIVDEGVTWGAIEALVRSLDLPDLESLAFFDEYRGKQVGAGKKSLAFSLTYRASDRTLTGDEVDASQKRAIESLEQGLGARIRDH